MNRQEFERFISSPPFEKDIKRFPTDSAKYSWPGAYCDITVELAWECWREATSMQIARFESKLAEAESELNRLQCAIKDEKVASGVLSAFWRRVYGAANFTAFAKQVLTAHMLTALSGIDVFSKSRVNPRPVGRGVVTRCELAETVCPDCGPVSVGPDIFDKDVPISGICPKCGDRLYFAERGSDD